MLKKIPSKIPKILGKLTLSYTKNSEKNTLSLPKMVKNIPSKIPKMQKKIPSHIPNILKKNTLSLLKMVKMISLLAAPPIIYYI